MRVRLLVNAISALLFLPALAVAADLPYLPRAQEAIPVCPPQGHSQLINIPDLSLIQAEVQARYVEAVQVSTQLVTEASRSERITWAYASRTACGIALGMLSMSELDSDRLWNCECYHARMRATMVK